MQLGDCLVDLAKGEMTNVLTGKSWHLPRAELQVLRLLVENQGKVVLKQQLKAGNAEYAALSDSSVARAVFMLRSFIGPQYEYLIETVKGKGYLLQDVVIDLADSRSVESLSSAGEKLDPAIASLGSVEERRQQAISQSQKSDFTEIDVMPCATGKKRPSIPLITLAASALFLLLFTALFLSLPEQSKEVTKTKPMRSDVVKLKSGQFMSIHLYAASNTNNRLLLQQSQEIQQAFALCEQSDWRHVYIALSHDNQVLNMTLRGDSVGQSVVRNLKITDSRSAKNKQFVSVRWLLDAEICD